MFSSTRSSGNRFFKGNLGQTEGFKEEIKGTI